MTQIIRIGYNISHITLILPRPATKVILLEGTDRNSIVALNDQGAVVPSSFSTPSNEESFRIDDSFVYKGEKKFVGRLIHSDETGVVLQGKHAVIHINNYDYMTTRSRLARLVALQEPFTCIRYTVKTIRWHCVGNLFVEEDGQGVLVLLAHICNDLQGEHDLQGELVGRIILSAGSLIQPESRNYVPPAGQFALRAEMSKDEGGKEDLISYSLGIRSLPSHSSQPLGQEHIRTEKIYVHKISQQTTIYGYRIVAPFFIPEGILNIYKPGQVYIGASTIKETRKGDTRDAIIGESSLLNCTSSLSQYRESEKFEGTTRLQNNYSFHVSITNYGENALCLLKLPIGTETVFSFHVDSPLLAVRNKYALHSGQVELLCNIPGGSPQEPYTDIIKGEISTYS